ncbi:hypothetical protein BJ170DRAFT_633362 [Xylariales sp. AK1849]|nr:hypothetical protein BJ170DRAFT_633362 [Xylariales sp. AK1849]
MVFRPARPMSPPNPPFSVAHQLSSALNKPAGSSLLAQRLPGYPCVPLQDRRKVMDFLNKEFCSGDLDRIADKLWWMSKQDSGNVSPLHRQSIKRRVIIITEDPKLHLVWVYDRIFIKPLPRYITSHTFWQDYLYDDADDDTQEYQIRIRKAALGYLRTYKYLVQYESDFRIAQDSSLRLIPNDITWEQFSNFLSGLADISDHDVSLRYAYGEIRLTRLNFYAPFLLHKSNFQRVEYQYGTYFARFYGPVLFVIGIMSVILSGMQVSVAVEQNQSETGGQAMSSVALWFSVVIILIFFGILLCFFFLLLYKVVKEWRYAIRDRIRLLEEGRLSGYPLRQAC